MCQVGINFTDNLRFIAHVAKRFHQSNSPPYPSRSCPFACSLIVGHPRELGRVIGIDEYARRQGHRSKTLIVDLDKGQPIATLQGRRADAVMPWFTSHPQDERDQVAVVVLAMSTTYFAAMQEVFGDRVHVIDRFPVVNQAVDALDAYRLEQKAAERHGVIFADDRDRLPGLSAVVAW
jgi:transposase